IIFSCPCGRALLETNAGRCTDWAVEGSWADFWFYVAAPGTVARRCKGALRVWSICGRGGALPLGACAARRVGAPGLEQNGISGETPLPRVLAHGHHYENGKI